METSCVVLLNYATSEIIKIKLTDEEFAEGENSMDFEGFLMDLEEKYQFRLKDCCWMSTYDKPSERSYGFEGEMKRVSTYSS